MSFDIFQREESVITQARALLAERAIADPAAAAAYERLLKAYEKLSRTTRRLIKLSDRNEEQLNRLARTLNDKNEILKALSDRLQHELDTARALQLGMLPRVFPAWSPQQPVQVYALMEPAREVGGDLYDCFYASKHIFCFLVGDVSGKGAAAAMFMARTRSLVRMAVEYSYNLRVEEILPARIAEAVNRELYQNNPERMFVTLFLGFLDIRTGALHYINAGHPAPHLLRGTNDIKGLDGKPEMPLGVRPNTVYQGRAAMLHPGDAVVVYTDGVTEAMNISEELYTTERLNSHLHTARKGTPEEIVRAVKDHVDAFTGLATKADDVTLLALRWHAPASDQWS